MSVQIIPAPANRRPSTAENLNKLIGTGLEAYAQQQKQKDFSNALKDVENIYADPGMTQEQKFIRAFSSLKNYPEAAKQFASGLSQFSERPLQKAQRLKLEQETAGLQDEESYLKRLMSSGLEQETTFPEETSDFGAEQFEEATPKKPFKKTKFDFNDPTTWSEKQLDEFRSIEGKSSKAKSLARRAQNEFDRRQEMNKATQKYKETITPFQGALETLDQMEKIGSRGNLGIGTKARGIISPQTRRDAAEYERLGKSLISFSSNIPIRNRQEFETLAHDLYDPSISDDARAGILAAMKRIVQNAIGGVLAPEVGRGYSPQPQRSSIESKPKERPSLTSFYR